MAEYVQADTKPPYTVPVDQIRGQDNVVTSIDQYRDTDKANASAAIAGNPKPVEKVEPLTGSEIPKDAIENTVPPTYVDTVENPTSTTQLDQAGKQQTAVTCPFCKESVTTRVESHGSGFTVACGVFLGLLCTCLVCIPCLAGWFQDIEHYCPRCHKMLARKRYHKAIEVFQPSKTTRNDAPKDPPTQHQAISSDNPTTD